MIEPVGVVESLECCGVSEIVSLSECDDAAEMAKGVLCRAEYESYDEDDRIVLDIPQVGHLVFTQAGKLKNTTKGYGFSLKTYIERHGLGTVTASEGGKNPNSGNFIHTFVWTLDEKGIRQWAKKNGYGRG